MKSTVSCHIILDKEEIKKGDYILVEPNDLVITQDGSERYLIELRHKTILANELDVCKQEDSVSKLEVHPKIAHESDIALIYDLLFKESYEWDIDMENFSDFIKNHIFITYDYGDEKIIFMMGSSNRETYLNGKITASNSVYKWHIKNGVAKEGDIDVDYDYLDED